MAVSGMTGMYRDALLEYLALTQLEDNLRDVELRSELLDRKKWAQEKLEDYMRKKWT